ncbi:hypothetical protein GF380_06000, partial [Candidatus Uhrbacteria bacterium]|nr:hypothetical protein [Candidatus Uhrbacteria bacterium]MBD3284691.1 hypothetical protein [Candidatus Uhrbacteria bacterium]
MLLPPRWELLPAVAGCTYKWSDVSQKQIVVLGGGTGTHKTNSGLKKLPDVTIRCIVSMSDDGGSTGELRVELGVLPPGDVRQNLVALSDAEELFLKVFNERVKSNGRLNGH